MLRALKRLTFCAVVLSSAITSHAAINIADPFIGPAAGSRPFIASNGSSFLILWTAGTYARPQIRGVVANASAIVVTSPSFLAIPDARLMALAAAGEDFVAAWNDSAGAAHLTLLGPDGTIVRQIPYSATPQFVFPRLAISGDRVLIVDTDAFASQATSTLLSLEGDVIGASLAPPGAQRDVFATANGFLVASADAENVYVQTVTRDGAAGQRTRVGTPVQIAGVFGYTFLGAATHDATTLVAWVDHSDTLSPIDTLSWITLPGGTQHKLERLSAQPLSGARVFWTGSSFVIAIGSSYDGRSSLLVRVDSAGNANPQPLKVESPAVNGANIGNVIFAALENGASEVVATPFRTGSSITYLGSTVISRGPESQSQPSLVSDGIGFAAAWLASTSSTNRIAAGRFTTAAERLDPAGIPIATNVAYTIPSIAAASSVYLTVWTTADGLFARRVGFSGEILDETPIQIAARALNARVTAAADKFLVSWIDGGRVTGTIVSADGTVGAPRPLSPEVAPVSEFAGEHRTAWDGRRFLVAWTAYQGGNPICECPPLLAGIRAVRVESDGAPIDQTPAMVGPDLARVAALASSGSEFLVVLNDGSAVFVDADHTALTARKPIPITRWPGGSLWQDVTWDGRDYVIARTYGFPDYIAGSAEPLSLSWLGTVRLARDGRVHDGTALPLGSAAAPAIAANEAGTVAIVVPERSEALDATRVRAYFENELAPLPTPPSPPVNVTATSNGEGNQLLVTWTSTSTDHDGFLIETGSETGFGLPAYVADRNATSARIFASGVARVRVSAFNAGGTSAEPLTAPPPGPRRRAAR